MQSGAYIWKSEVVETNFQINEGSVFLKHTSDRSADWLFEFIIAKIERNQRFVYFETWNQLNHAWEIFAVCRQLVALQIQKLQRLVDSQGFTELFCWLRTEIVAFQL